MAKPLSTLGIGNVLKTSLRGSKQLCDRSNPAFGTFLIHHCGLDPQSKDCQKEVTTMRCRIKSGMTEKHLLTYLPTNLLTLKSNLTPTLSYLRRGRRTSFSLAPCGRADLRTDGAKQTVKNLVPKYLSALVPSKRVAFTLAETLITLGIIGIVAAMTMPTLIQKKQDKELIVRTRKVWSDINNAFLLSHQDYGVVADNSILFNATDNPAVVAENLAKYFKGAKVCKYKSQNGCSQYYYDIKFATKQLDNDGNIKVQTQITDIARILLTNGAIIMVGTNKSGCANKEYTQTHPDGSTSKYFSTICGNLQFDVNGTQAPNQYGRDVYHFWVYADRLTPSFDKYLGGVSLRNILSGKDKLEYFNYTKGQKFD